MKTPKEILKNRFSKGFVDLDEVQESMVIECMLEFAMQEVKNLTIPDVSFSLRDKFAIQAMNGELSAQNFETGEHWANEKDLAQRAYLIADAMIKERSNES